MIVNYTSSGWDIVMQRAHGLLAARIASHLNFTYPLNRRLDTILAIAEHDDTGIEFVQHDLLTPAGGPVDFTMRGFDADHCRQLMLAGRAKSRYFSLLNAMHLVFVYGKENTKAAREFFHGLRTLIPRLRAELGISAALAEKTYALMQWCDALSLMICQRAVQPEHRLTEISEGPDGASYQLSQTSPDTLSIQPWPFIESKFVAAIEYRTVSQLQFASAVDFQRALDKADVKEKNYTFVAPKGFPNGKTKG